MKTKDKILKDLQCDMLTTIKPFLKTIERDGDPTRSHEYIVNKGWRETCLHISFVVRPYKPVSMESRQIYFMKS